MVHTRARKRHQSNLMGQDTKQVFAFRRLTCAKVIMIKNGAAKVLVCDENSLLKRSSSSKDATITKARSTMMIAKVNTEQGHSTHRSSSR